MFRRLIPLLIALPALAGAEPYSPLNALMPLPSENLYQLQEMVARMEDPASKTQHWRETLMSALEAHPAPSTDKRRTEISLAEATEIVRIMDADPVVGIKSAPKYDPQSNWGYCFGRAAWAYMELLRRGVAKGSIKKIFAVGPMAAWGMQWQFHVATIVRSKGGWVVIDTVPGKPLKVEKWMDYFAKQNSDKTLMFFVSEPSRVNPLSNSRFNARHFRNDFTAPEYRAYFQDMVVRFQNLSWAKNQNRLCRNVFKPDFE